MAVPVANAADANAAASCRAVSGDSTAALIELYTSEGCDSCPPADRWLSQVDRAMAGRSFVALAYHVDYWDRLGWKDRFASADFTARQHEQTDRRQGGFVYTPQVSIQGRDYRDWQSADRLQRTLQTINTAPARARISLQVSGPSAARVVDVGVDAQVESGHRGDVQLTVALAQNGLVSEVAAGENAGKRLAHDHVVRAWDRGLALSPGSLRQDVHFTLPRDRGPLSVVAFVEDRRSGDVLQVLELALCDGRVSQASPKPNP